MIKRLHRRFLAASLGAISSVVCANASAGGRSAYLFAYSEPASDLMINSMSFDEERSVDVEGQECTITLKTNGPIGCFFTCDNRPSCLLGFDGPSNLGVADILEKLEEVPISDSSTGGPGLETGPEHHARMIR